MGNKLEIDWNHFREGIDIEEVADILGISTNCNGFFNCPCHDDAHASAKIYPKTNSWTCFSCQEGGGSVLDLVRAVNGGTILDAALFLDKIYPGGIKQIEMGQAQEHDYPNIPREILKKIGIQHNPYISWKSRGIVGVNESGKAVHEEEKIKLSYIEATDLILEKAVEYQNRLEAYKKQVLYNFPDLDDNAKQYITKKTESEKAVLTPYIESLREFSRTLEDRDTPAFLEEGR